MIACSVILAIPVSTILAIHSTRISYIIKRNALNGTSLEKMHRINKEVTRFLLKKKGRKGRKKVIDTDGCILIIFGEGGSVHG